ncbi:MAG: hypothetical protein ACLFWL_01320 [Candidatus Brocadiia bacterium]
MKKVALIALIAAVSLWGVVTLQGWAEDRDAKEALRLVDEATQKHIAALEGVLEKVPEEAKPAIKESMKVSRLGQQKAHEAVKMARADGSMEQAKLHWERANDRAKKLGQLRGEGSGQYAQMLASEYQQAVQETVSELDRARQQGAGVEKALQAVRSGTAKHRKVLERAANLVPEKAQQAIQRAIRHSATGRKAALKALQRARSQESKTKGREERKGRGKPDEQGKRRKDASPRAGAPEDTPSGPPKGVGRP